MSHKKYAGIKVFIVYTPRFKPAVTLGLGLPIKVRSASVIIPSPFTSLYLKRPTLTYLIGKQHRDRLVIFCARLASAASICAWLFQNHLFDNHKTRLMNGQPRSGYKMSNGLWHRLQNNPASSDTFNILLL
jgi:hypothetical protein